MTFFNNIEAARKYAANCKENSTIMLVPPTALMGNMYAVVKRTRVRSLLQEGYKEVEQIKGTWAQYNDNMKKRKAEIAKREGTN